MVYIYIHVSSHLHYFLGVYLSTFVKTQLLVHFIYVIDICHETESLFCGHNIFHRNYSGFKILQPSYHEPPIL